MSVRFGPFEVDPYRRLLRKDGRDVHLTPKAFDLLTVLVAEAPRVVRKDELHQRLWPGTFVSDATLAGLIKEIRRALDAPESKTPLIRTAHGVGYAFDGRIERVLSSPPSIVHWLVVGSRRVAVVDGDNFIGRDATATLHFEAAGISRRHAKVVVAGHQARIEDLGSKNGTMVNDSAVTVPRELQDGDRIQVGPIVIVYHASISGMSTETLIRPT